MASKTATTTESRALALLGDNVDPETVAMTLGVSASRISQLLSDEDFAGKVVALKYSKLTDINARDDKYDGIEDALLTKLEKSMSFMVKPEVILKALQIVSGVKRRGATAPTQAVNQQTIVNLIIPKAIVQQFTTNSKNQVVATSERSLAPMQSGTLLKQIEDQSAIAAEECTN